MRPEAQNVIRALRAMPPQARQQQSIQADTAISHRRK
jgi:hypothetical protein